MKIFTYIKSHAVLSSGIAIVAVLGMIIAGRVSQRGGALESNLSNIKKVTLVDVSNFRDDLSRVSADGIVESVSQVDLKSQLSGPLSVVNVAVGDTVYAGQTIAMLQNADISAQLDQARAGLQAAQGQYAGSGISLESARSNALETLRSSYQTADDVVNTQIEQFLYRSVGGNPPLSSYIAENKVGNAISDHYLAAKNSFLDWKNSIDALNVNSSHDTIIAAIELSQKNLKNISQLIDGVSQAISDALKNNLTGTTYTTVTGWQSVTAGARTSINTAIKNLTTAEASFAGAQVTLESPAEAQIASARAMVKNLEAQLAKTIITSPISGKIAALPLRAGELAQPGQLIATVVGGGGLQVKAYASSEDLAKIKTGAKVLIQGTIVGTVVNVAPSVNQINKKIEVKVSVGNTATTSLVIGQNVAVSIEAAEAPAASASTSYLLPIQNVKIIPGAAHVFTLDPENKVVKNSVILGKIQGDFVEITSGISPEMKIVSPVYELEEGEVVTVQ